MVTFNKLKGGPFSISKIQCDQPENMLRAPNLHLSLTAWKTLSQQDFIAPFPSQELESHIGASDTSSRPSRGVRTQQPCSAARSHRAQKLRSMTQSSTRKDRKIESREDDKSAVQGPEGRERSRCSVGATVL